MILLADSGSSKTDWRLIYEIRSAEDWSHVDFSTEGYNPCYMDSMYIASSLESHFPADTDKDSITKVCYFGAGCYETAKRTIHKALETVFPNAAIDVEMDMVAAAKALLGDEPGLAAILGTGTNTCIYDGSAQVQTIDGLGFILGDEGSGGYMGRKLIVDYLRGRMPTGLHKIMSEEFDLTEDSVIERIYNQPMPNRFCASFAKFISAHINEFEYLRSLVKWAFRDFFTEIITRYPDYNSYRLNCIGSVAYHFQDYMTEICREFGMQPGVFEISPMEGLTKYYVRRYQP